MSTDYMLQGSFGRVRTVDPAGPVAYYLDTFVPGYRPTRTRFRPDQFDEAYALYVLLTDASYDAGLGPEAVQWSAEY